MSDIAGMYNDLDAYIAELLSKFIDRYIPADPAITPAAYGHDVKAFCILSHAAFEEFIEMVVLKVAAHAVSEWKISRKTTEPLITLLSWNKSALKIDEKETNPETSIFDYLRPLIDEASASFARHVFANHGISVSYLRELLTPVGIEVKQDPTLLNSLMKLAEGRGAYAHKGRGKGVLAPEDAKTYVADVLALCGDIQDKAKAKLT